GRQRADLAKLRREYALLAEELHAHGVERRQVVGRAHGRFGLAQQFRDAAHRELPDAWLGGESLFRGRDERDEAFVVVYCDVGEDLAIDVDLRERQPVHQAAVRQPVRARRGVDTRDPQSAELALTHAAVAERVLAGLDDGLLRSAKDFAPRVVVALRLIEDLAMPRLGGNASFYSGHLSLLKRTAKDDEDLRRRTHAPAWCCSSVVFASATSSSGCGVCGHGRI